MVMGDTLKIDYPDDWIDREGRTPADVQQWKRNEDLISCCPDQIALETIIVNSRSWRLCGHWG